MLPISIVLEELCKQIQQLFACNLFIDNQHLDREQYKLFGKKVRVEYYK